MVGHYYRDTESFLQFLMPKYTHSFMHSVSWLYRAHSHIQGEAATDTVHTNEVQYTLILNCLLLLRKFVVMIHEQILSCNQRDT